MAQGAKKIRRLAGDDANVKSPVVTPLNLQDVYVAVVQLQETVNELIARFNAHTHSGVTAGGANSGAPTAGTTVTGTAQAATNLFVNAAQ